MQKTFLSSKNQKYSKATFLFHKFFAFISENMEILIFWSKNHGKIDFFKCTGAQTQINSFLHFFANDLRIGNLLHIYICMTIVHDQFCDKIPETHELWIKVGRLFGLFSAT